MTPAPKTVAVIGAGLAGVSTAAALAQQGFRVHLYHAPAAHPPASAVPLALLRPHLAAQRDPLERVRTLGLRVTRAWLGALAAAGLDNGQHSGGLILRTTGPRERRRLNRLPTRGSGPRRLAPEQVHAALGARLGAPALFHPHGACVDPVRFIRALLAIRADRITPIEQRITALDYRRDAWSLLQDMHCGAVGTYTQVVIANGPAASDLASALRGRLASARGQLTAVAATPTSTSQRLALSGGGYITPALAGRHWVGATLQRGDTDLAPRDVDDQDNAALFEAVWGEPATVVDRFVAVRGVTRDRLPIAGPLAPGLWASVGHGAHGLCTAPVCGRLIAWSMQGRSHPLLRWTSIERPALRVPSAE